MWWKRLYTWSSGAMVLSGLAFFIAVVINSDSRLIPWFLVGVAISGIVATVSWKVAGEPGWEQAGPAGPLGIALVTAATALLAPALALATYGDSDDQGTMPTHHSVGDGSMVGEIVGFLFLMWIVFAVIADIFEQFPRRPRAALPVSSPSKSSPANQPDLPSPAAMMTLALAIGVTLLGFARPAHAIVDCMNIEDMCKPGTECGWDANLHIHRCLPVAPAPKEPSAPTQAPAPAAQSAVPPSAAVSPSDDCTTPWTTDGCSGDRLNEYNACKRAVVAHNERCAKLRTCKDARERASRVCRTATEKGRVESVASSTWEKLCNEVTLDAKKACATIPGSPE